MSRAERGYELYGFLSLKIIEGIASRLGETNRAAAEAIADEVCDALIHEWGGMGFYLPKAVLSKCSSRNEQIFSEFNGVNFGALAKKYDLTDMRIRQIIKVMRAKAQQKA